MEAYKVIRRIEILNCLEKLENLPVIITMVTLIYAKQEGEYFSAGLSWVGVGGCGKGQGSGQICPNLEVLFFRG